MSVSRETALLHSYAALIRKWNPAINLVAPSTLDELEQRHIADSQQLVTAAEAARGHWVDLGSGGGLPGVVVAICRPDLAVTLIESDRRKSAFLRNVARELGLANTTVLNARIEAAPAQHANHVSARALAALPQLLAYASRHLRSDGTAWFLKGRTWQSEVDAARKIWQFRLEVTASRTDTEAAILKIMDLKHA
ncbi:MULTISPECIES: 16S rRNA (guanine(527)-N(7))-methyltransferase RsmG [unclassified Paracoccus (in: a-proteobacteria)]|uniref:16S rRNA (guanine(527)-N(7))-methyltransferase RsmG n=1 Tax=unclassified Paracoccus (in: a-proteobacteria) TaxID=2688777 RepID=UPI0012B1EF63|nr:MULTISPECIES: 16S rRNA (guanine(527)-N(7))-methyltransferase RsmG [unclassified Paracoccus (in: a-proteobacteria)]UXU75733.1 16S rRNA (guanine(527)-N(7))-methyltransferase RsmG [Paracoccus sp. SMMA_5]UXU81639.1 16S rRNA (guanine(527)-N(7))-methyltransferase RsmG [Paracoccus sp. SMMA_5_TC]